tara:strand:- start:68 stop:640 length:573 start_codon:yes stop_codon:yes gene_type:complete
MALWGSNDNLVSNGTVTLNYTAQSSGDFEGLFEVVGTGTTFGTTGFGATGNVIRFGTRGGVGVYFGDATIVGIASTTTCYIASTEGLTGAAIAATDYYLSELPSYTVDDYSYSEKNSGYDRIIYGISTTTSLAYDGSSTKYRTSGSGWVGVTTYNDCDGNFRVKSEILVAIGGDSGITTGSNGIAYPTAE